MMWPFTWISRGIYRLSERRDRSFDTRFGLDTVEAKLDLDVGQVADNLRPHVLDYYPTPIALFRRIVRKSRINPRHFGFVDLGAGKGRVLLLASDMGFDPVLGIEIDPSLCRIAENNIRRWSGQGAAPPVITQGDARTAVFPPGNLFVFLFNPFDGSIFNEVARQLAKLAREADRALIVAYHNDRCGELLEQTGAFRRVRMRRLHFWRPSTVSIFYNDRAWRMRNGR